MFTSSKERPAPLRRSFSATNMPGVVADGRSRNNHSHRGRSGRRGSQHRLRRLLLLADADSSSLHGMKALGSGACDRGMAESSHRSLCPQLYRLPAGSRRDKVRFIRKRLGAAPSMARSGPERTGDTVGLSLAGGTIGLVDASACACFRRGTESFRERAAAKKEAARSRTIGSRPGARSRGRTMLAAAVRDTTKSVQTL